MEIPKDRISSTDELGDRVTIYPASVKGYWRTHRNWTQGVLLMIFLLLPWLKVGGEQSILISIPERRFSFFGLVLYAHDTPMLFFLLAVGVFGLAFATAVWGRIWCGWACPQTVFIDAVFRRIETWVEGSHLKRRERDQGPLTINKVFLKSTKWFLFFIASMIIAHSFAAYFLGSSRLAQMSLHSPQENWVPFTIVFFFTFLVLFDFGWFREQFCIIMCPYGRFQSVLMDKHSLAVLYNEKRGEPRKGAISKENSTQAQGDCVNCQRCVMVCPTGIDIRRGVQLECINCTACIDACDEIMEKVHKPKGLIQYSSFAKNEGKATRFFNFRRSFYLFLILLATAGLIYQISTRTPLRAEILRVVGAPYRVLEAPENDMIINQFKVHLQNQYSLPLKVKFVISPNSLSQENQNLSKTISLIEQDKEITLSSGEITNHYLFIKFHKDLTKAMGQKEIDLLIQYSALPSSNPDQTPASELVQTKKVKLLGPWN